MFHHYQNIVGVSQRFFLNVLLQIRRIEVFVRRFVYRQLQNFDFLLRNEKNNNIYFTFNSWEAAAAV